MAMAMATVDGVTDDTMNVDGRTTVVEQQHQMANDGSTTPRRQLDDGDKLDKPRLLQLAHGSTTTPPAHLNHTSTTTADDGRRQRTPSQLQRPGGREPLDDTSEPPRLRLDAGSQSADSCRPASDASSAGNSDLVQLHLAGFVRLHRRASSAATASSSFSVVRWSAASPASLSPCVDQHRRQLRLVTSAGKGRIVSAKPLMHLHPGQQCVSAWWCQWSCCSRPPECQLHTTFACIRPRCSGEKSLLRAAPGPNASRPRGLTSPSSSVSPASDSSIAHQSTGSAQSCFAPGTVCLFRTTGNRAATRQTQKLVNRSLCDPLKATSRLGLPSNWPNASDHRPTGLHQRRNGQAGPKLHWHRETPTVGTTILPVRGLAMAQANRVEKAQKATSKPSSHIQSSHLCPSPSILGATPSRLRHARPRRFDVVNQKLNRLCPSKHKPYARKVLSCWLLRLRRPAPRPTSLLRLRI
jgi:hypothetical protein